VEEAAAVTGGGEGRRDGKKETPGGREALKKIDAGRKKV